MNKQTLKQEKRRLLQQVAKIDRELERLGSVNTESATGRARIRPLRVVTLDFLHDSETMLYSQSISQVCRALYDRNVPSTRFGTLSNDEKSSFQHGRGRAVYLCHGLRWEGAQAVKRLWARSDWELWQRIVGPTTGRVSFLKFSIWTMELAQKTNRGESAAARPELLNYLAADCARDVGIRVRKGDKDFANWKDAASAELDRLESEDKKFRLQAADELVHKLNSLQVLFGASEPLVSLPGTKEGWRSNVG